MALTTKSKHPFKSEHATGNRMFDSNGASVSYNELCEKTVRKKGNYSKPDMQIHPRTLAVHVEIF